MEAMLTLQYEYTCFPVTSILVTCVCCSTLLVHSFIHSFNNL